MKNVNELKKIINEDHITREIHATNTAALSDEYHKIKESNVTIPSEHCAMCAKEWVDDGSKL